MNIGVLALQGAFYRHVEALEKLGVKAIDVRKPLDLEKCEGLIIPGGESTTIIRQLEFIKMGDALRQFAQAKPLFGTCAGLILMSRAVVSDPMTPFGWLDITVERNAFGRQVESFRVDLQVDLSPPKKIPAIFIRAPRIRSVGSNVKVLAQFEGEPVLVQEGCHLGASFHPELTLDPSLHEYFLRLVEENQKAQSEQNLL